MIPARACIECGLEYTPRSNVAKYCDACRATVRAAQARQAKRNWVARNPERRREAARAYVERHPERRRVTVRRDWERIRADPEKYAHFLSNGRESYARTAERGKAYTNRWRREHPDAWANIQRRRRERANGVTSGDPATADEYATIIRRDPCCYCGAPCEHVDHIVPLADSGDGSWDNLTSACKPCNSRKHTRPLLHFLLGRQQMEAKAAA